MKSIQLLILLCVFSGAVFAQEKPIVIETKNTALVYKSGMQNKLVQAYFGEKLTNAEDYNNLFGRNEAYAPAGGDNLNEPAIRMVHNDGNPSLALSFDKVEVNRENDNVSTTVIWLKDDVYPVSVKCFLKRGSTKTSSKPGQKSATTRKSRFCLPILPRRCSVLTNAITG